MNAATVLLVEDDPDDVDLVRLALRRLGRPVCLHVCSDGQAVLELLRDQPTAGVSLCLVLLDVKLPGMSGIEVLRVLRATPVTAHVPVVLMTSSVEERDLVEGYGAGASAYVRKPDSFTALVDLLGVLVRFWLDVNVVPTVAPGCR